MTGINHATTGILVASSITHPVLGLPAALLSHFLIDMIPHWNYELPSGVTVKRIAMLADLGLSIIITLVLIFLTDTSGWVVGLATCLAILPDAMWLPNMLYDKPTKPDKTLIGRMRAFHQKIQWSETSKGALVELVWAVLMLGLITKYFI